MARASARRKRPVSVNTPPLFTAPITETRWLLCSWTKTETCGSCMYFSCRRARIAVCSSTAPSPAAGNVPIRGSVMLPLFEMRSLRPESSWTSKTETSMRSPGPSGRSLSSCAEAVWLRSLRFKSLALIAGTAAGGAGKLLLELLDVAEASAGVAAGVLPAGRAVCRWIPAQEDSASPAAITPSARKRPLNNNPSTTNGPPGRRYGGQWGFLGGQGFDAGFAIGPTRFVDAAAPAAMPTPTPATEPAPIAPIAPMAPVAPDSPRVVATSDVG